MEFKPIALTIKQLGFERNYRFLFENMNCELRSGDLLQVRGNNGSGKSTLLRILAGFLEPHTGSILWQNEPIVTNLNHYQQHIQYIGHQHGIKKYLTVYENLLLNCALTNHTPRPNQLKNILDEIGLLHCENTSTLHLSAGQLRRLALSRLLLYPAPLWILDEPATALDAASQALLNHLLLQQLARGGLAIVATHQDLIMPHIKSIYLKDT